MKAKAYDNFVKIKCETCGQEHYCLSDNEAGCCNIECPSRQYNHDYTDSQYRELAHLRERYIGTIINGNSTFVVLDILDLQTAVYMDIAGFKLYILPIRCLRFLGNKE